MFGGRCSAVKGQRSEVRRQSSEVSSQRSAVGLRRWMKGRICGYRFLFRVLLKSQIERPLSPVRCPTVEKSRLREGFARVIERTKV